MHTVPTTYHGYDGSLAMPASGRGSNRLSAEVEWAFKVRALSAFAKRLRPARACHMARRDYVASVASSKPTFNFNTQKPASHAAIATFSGAPGSRPLAYTAISRLRVQSEGGLFYEPTTLVAVPRDCVAAGKEMFGPAIAVLAYDTVVEAFEMLKRQFYRTCAA